MDDHDRAALYMVWYDKYYPRVLRNMKMWTYDTTEREDIAQETFLRVWQQLMRGNYNEELSAPYTWIHMIAAGAAQRLMDQKANQIPAWSDDIHSDTDLTPPDMDDDDPELFTSDPSDFEYGLVDYNSPEVSLMREQEEEGLEGTVQSMSNDYREILALHYYDAYSYKEIAEKLGIPMETVRTRLRRAREQLKALLGEE